MPNPYDADYFLRGKETGKSLYENYRWMPELTIPMVKAIVAHCGIKPEDTILDFGCARGYVVRAFRELGYAAFGMDCSDWAIENCDPNVKEYVGKGANDEMFDWIIAKDVLEHIDSSELWLTLRALMCRARRGVFIVVPLASDFGPGKKYVVPEYEQDVTHVQRISLMDWADLMHAASTDFAIRALYRVRGVKDNYAQYEKGNGFLTAYRVTQS